MSRIIILTLGLVYFFTNQISAQLQHPNDFLPHKIGEKFTPHHMLVDYMHHVAELNDNILLKEYGKTNQDRPLLQLTISSQSNIDNIEKIRLNNLYRAGHPKGESYPEVDNIAIVWLSFSVHGNEAAGSESSMPVIYELANKSNLRTQKWLENTVVIFDPSINPDGYSRYTHWQRNVAAKDINTNPDDREHAEPWPGGRVNHYLFDLNRDWAWQTQIESQQRMKLFNMWLPQIHVDFHEMGSNSPYYFAPAARPYHDYITEWQADFQHEIGKNHAKYFDKEGWLYFTKEVFDLFYPSYGDTYPTFNGGIGMTYEQGGGSRAARALETGNGETLSLKDRVDHHFTTALSTIEVSSVNAARLIEQFKVFYNKDVKGKYKSYLVKGENQDKVRDLTKLLDKQDIQYHWTQKGGSGTGFSYQNGETEKFEIEEGDLIVDINQPKKLFVQVLMDPESALEDSLTYDITSWALPYAYGVEAYASTSLLSFQSMEIKEESEIKKEEDFYAVIIDWNSLDAARIVAQLSKKEVRYRLTSVPFAIDGKKFPRSSIVITKADNFKLKENLLELVKEAGANQEDIQLVKTGFADSGKDLGSGSVSLLRTPKVLALSGEGTRTNSFGQLWYFMEQVVDYPATYVNADQFARIDLDKYNVLILVDGWYNFREGDYTKIQSWVRGGGKLINIGSANNSFSGQKGFALKKFATDEEEKENKKASEEDALNDRFHSYEGQSRRRVVDNVPGAIYEIKMDDTHPLAYGLSEQYFSLKTSSMNFRPLKGAWNVGIIPDDTFTVGFTGSKIKNELKGSVNFAVEDMGRGCVVYLVDNPLFRGFWNEGLLLFSNALFLVE